MKLKVFFLIAVLCFTPVFATWAGIIGTTTNQGGDACNLGGKPNTSNPAFTAMYGPNASTGAGTPTLNPVYSNSLPSGFTTVPPVVPTIGWCAYPPCQPAVSPTRPLIVPATNVHASPTRVHFR
jgi:hypothetical protein